MNLSQQKNRRGAALMLSLWALFLLSATVSPGRWKLMHACHFPELRAA